MTCFEDECHVLLYCPFYADLKEILLAKCKDICDNFNHCSACDKVNFILSNSDFVFISTKTCRVFLKAMKSFIQQRLDYFMYLIVYILLSVY